MHLKKNRNMHAYKRIKYIFVLKFKPKELCGQSEKNRKQNQLPVCNFILPVISRNQRKSCDESNKYKIQA